MNSNVLVYDIASYKIDVMGVFVADTFIDRFIGYMFRKEPHHKAIMFTPCNSIHTFFMRFPIDVIFVNKDLEIINKVENLKPRKIILPVKDAVIVIEGKGNTLKNLKIGDKITMW